MPEPEVQNAPLLIHSSKYALREALETYPQTPDRNSLLEALIASGDDDGRVAFSESQARFVQGTLIPWASENRPFRGDDARKDMGIFLLEKIGEAL